MFLKLKIRRQIEDGVIFLVDNLIQFVTRSHLRNNADHRRIFKLCTETRINILK